MSPGQGWRALTICYRWLGGLDVPDRRGYCVRRTMAKRTSPGKSEITPTEIRSGQHLQHTGSRRERSGAGVARQDTGNRTGRGFPGASLFWGKSPDLLPVLPG
jgi:hypothetical protein